MPISGRYDCAAMGDDAGMGNDEKGCYVHEYSNGFLFVVCALSFIVSLAVGPIALVHLGKLFSAVVRFHGIDVRFHKSGLYNTLAQFQARSKLKYTGAR